MRSSLFLLALASLSLSAFAEDKKITVAAGGAPALSLTVPKEAEVTTDKEKTTIRLPHLHVYLWPVAKAKTVAEAVPQAATIIKSEFTDLAVADTKALTVAGHDAKHLFGKGAEADDGDPGTAEVVIFTEGKHVFAACVHGEKDEAAKQSPGMLGILKTAKAP